MVRGSAVAGYVQAMLVADAVKQPAAESLGVNVHDAVNLVIIGGGILLILTIVISITVITLQYVKGRKKEVKDGEAQTVPENVIEKLRSENRWLQRRLENSEASRRVIVAPREIVVTKSGNCFHVADQCVHMSHAETACVRKDCEHFQGATFSLFAPV